MSPGNGSSPSGKEFGLEGLSLNSTAAYAKQYSDISADGHARQHNGDVNQTTNNYNYLPRSDDQLSGSKVNQALLIAAGAGHTRRVIYLISKKKADVEYADQDGMTALHYACMSGFVDTTEALLSEGADVDARSEKYGTPLLVATLKERSAIVTLLLKERADPSPSSETLGSPLHLACFIGNLDLAEALIQAGANVSLRATIDRLEVERLQGIFSNRQHWPTHWQGEALVLAAWNDHLVMVDLLLEAGADPNGLANFWRASNGVKSENDNEAKLPQWRGVTAMLIAAKNGHSAIVNLLLDARADCDIVAEHWSAERRYFGSPLSGAIADGQCDTVDILLRRGASVCKAGKESLSALTTAALTGCLRCLNACIRAGCDLNYVDSFAAIYGFADGIEALLAAGVEVELSDSCGGTALLIATDTGHLSCIKVLLKHGADANKPDRYGRTPLLLAVEKGYKHTVIELLNSGGDPTVANEEGTTALMVAAQLREVFLLNTIFR